MSGSGGRLPFFDRIQAAFGRHDISHVQAHTDPAASQGARAMGAQAFASGSHIAFSGAPELHTAAHEAAHVVQQRAGVHLKGGVGEAGDAHERHADAVADRVVRGESAEALLSEYAPRQAAAGAPSVQRRLWMIKRPDGPRYVEERSGHEFELIAKDVYMLSDNRAFNYHDGTDQYTTMFHTTWDPETDMELEVASGGRYLHRTSGRYYRYDGQHYVAETTQTTTPMTTLSTPSLSTPSLPKPTPTLSTPSLPKASPTMSTSSLPAKPTSSSAPRNPDAAGAKLWLAEEYGYIKHDEKGQRQIRDLIDGIRLSSPDDAWKLLENWNAVCEKLAIFPSEVGLDASTKSKDIDRDKQSRSSMMIVSKTDIALGEDYHSGKPSPGSAIRLPRDYDLTQNLDRYWRGKDGESGGSAIGRKLEKHGENSSSDLEFARAAFAFARANNTNWFYQSPNQIVFHNYKPSMKEGTQVKMAVWDYREGAMVTFYTVEPSKVGGDILEYLKSRGYEG